MQQREIEDLKTLEEEQNAVDVQIPLKEGETIEDLKTREEETECHRPSKLL